MSGLRISLQDLKNTESQFSSAAREQLQKKLVEIAAETKKKKAIGSKRRANGASKSTTPKANTPKPESPAQANLRHLLNIDPLLAAYKNDWVEDFIGASQKSRYEIDFALPNLKIGIEVDGWQYHGKYKEAFLRDREKDFEIKSNGWVLLRLQAGILLNHRKLGDPLNRIKTFLDCWVPRQQIIERHLKELPNDL